MCGLTGFLHAGGFALSPAQQMLAAQTTALEHRGPDDAGSWLDPSKGIALGHRRLSILDLSPAGHQPMISASGRFVVVLNGEIYNHLEIRAQLGSSRPSPMWRGHSDTESLLAGFEARGIEGTLKIAVGMFAFVVWDRQDNVLTLARDRMGEKPLYYGWQRGTFLFGSELKSLRAHPDFSAEIDREVLADYMRHGYIRAPRSIYRGIFQVPPGTYLQLAADGAIRSSLRSRTYWTLRQSIERGAKDQFSGDDVSAVAELHALLKQSVGLQVVADVSVGAFLSGGIDSSLIVALMQTQSSKPVKTFTIGFGDPRFNEAPYARAVAQHLGTDHTELLVDAQDALDVIPKLATIYDEPFGDSSAIPTFLVSQLARSKVTVSLSGDGGDELFGGYSRYQRTADIWNRTARLPYAVRKPIAVATRGMASLMDAGSAGPMLGRMGEYLSARTYRECYDIQFSNPVGLSGAVIGGSASAGGAVAANRQLESSDNLFDHMMYVDATTYLPDDILVKVDRASMAVSLESRIPILDHRIVDFAWRLPLHMKVRQGRGKWILKEILRSYVPAGMIDRKKMGFGIPVGDWIRGPLREWAESLLSEPRLREQGLFDAAIVRKHWSRFLKGGRVSSDNIWQLLMFQSWLNG